MRGAKTATDPDASSAGDSELARIMARTLDCLHLPEEFRFFFQPATTVVST